MSQLFIQKKSQEALLHSFATWNVQGLTKKKKETFAEIEREKVDLVVLTETKLRGAGREDVGEYIHLYSGVKTGPSRAGVSIFIKKDLGLILGWEAIKERIITAKLNIHGQEVNIIGVYWVDGNKSNDTKDRFQDDLRNLLKRMEKEHELIILGDFNGNVGTSTDSKVVGNFGVKDINNNGERLIDVCLEFGMKIQNPFFDHEDIHKYTWYSRRNSSKSLIDYCITRQETKLGILDVLACRWLECGTDHIFLETTISFPVGKTNENRAAPTVEPDTLEMIKYKTYLLYSKTFRNSYIEYLDSAVNISTERSTKEMYKHLKESIHAAAFHVLGIQDKELFGEILWDKEIKELRAKRLNMINQTENQPILDQSTFDSDFDKIKNEMWKGICSTVDKAKRNEGSEKAWRILDDVLNKSNGNVINQQPSEDFCRSFFKTNRIGVKEFEMKKEGKKVNLNKIDPGQTVQISVEDVTKALNELHDDKWPSPGGLNVQLLRNSNLETKSLLRNLIQDIFNGKELPPEICEAYISNIVKIKNSEKYAVEDGLQVHCIMRVMCFLLNEMLEKNCLKNSSPVVRKLTHLEATFTLRLLLQKNAAKQNSSFHFAFVDLKQMYFGVQHSKLLKILEKQGISKNFLAIIEHLLKSNTVRIVTANKFSEKFTLSRGLIEQCNLGPTLLKMYIQESIKAWDDENLQDGITIDNRILSYIISNDKIIIVAPNHTSLGKMVLSLKDYLKDLNLHIGFENLKYLGCKKLTLGRTTIEGQTVVAFDDSYLELDGRNLEEVSNRIIKTKNAIGYLHPVVRDEHVSMRNKKRIFNIIIRCILLKGCETWTLANDLKASINSVEMNYWKWWCEKQDVKYTPRQLRTEMGIKFTGFDILMVRKAAWYTKVNQMSLDMWPLQILNWDPTGTGKRGRPRKKWIDGIKDIFKDISKYKHYLRNHKLFFSQDKQETVLAHSVLMS